MKAPDGARGLSEDATRAWVDQLDASEARKSAVIDAVADSYERCRGVPAVIASKDKPTS